MRADFDEKLQQLDEDLEKEPRHIAIVMLGAWDRVSVRDSAGKRVASRQRGLARGISRACRPPDRSP